MGARYATQAGVPMASTLVPSEPWAVPPKITCWIVFGPVFWISPTTTRRPIESIYQLWVRILMFWIWADVCGTMVKVNDKTANSTRE